MLLDFFLSYQASRSRRILTLLSSSNWRPWCRSRSSG